MFKRIFAMGLMTAFAFTLPAIAQDTACEEASLRATQLSAGKDFDGAVNALKDACTGEAATPGSRLQLARILSWAGRYDEAEAQFNAILAEDPDNLDVLVARGSLYYYKGDLDKAAETFQFVLDRSPTYGDAKEGLNRVLDAKAAADDALGPVWRLDTNYSETEVEGAQPDWSDFTARGAYRRGNYSYSAQVSQLNRFGLRDTEIILGVDRVARKGTNFSAHVSFTPSADFRADVGAGAGVSHIFDTAWGPVLQAGVRYDYDRFGDSNIHTVTPELIAYFDNGLVLSGRGIGVAQDSLFTAGWVTQAYVPFGDRLGGTIGYAQAPEVINGIALDTESIFGGLSFKVAEGLSISANYSRDNREAAFDREGFNVGFTFRR